MKECVGMWESVMGLECEGVCESVLECEEVCESVWECEGV